MRYAQIKKMDIADGSGVRVGLYTQGCPLKCDGCHNKEQQNYDGGYEYTEETKNRILQLCAPDYISGLSILGGEPLIERNLRDLAKLIKEFKSRFPAKTIWIWTGYTYEFLKSKFKVSDSNYDNINFIFDNIDVLVDGPFILAKKDISDKNIFRGSSNQRLIDMKATRKANKAINYQLN